MEKKYNFTINDITNWFSESLNEFKVSGNVDELCLKGKEKGKRPISVKNEMGGQGWVIFEPTELQKKRKYLEIKHQHELLVLIRSELQKLRNIDIISGSINELDSCQKKIIAYWDKLQILNQNSFINKEIDSLLKTAPKQSIPPDEKILALSENADDEKRITQPRNWMEGELSQMSINNQEKNNLTLIQIALLNIYENKQITRDNANKIANEYGYNAKTSGEALYQKFNKYCKPTDRKGDEGTKRKNQNKIKRLESVIELLSPNKQDRVKDEIQILKKILESEY